MNMPFDPLDYVIEFAFPDGDEVDVVVEKMPADGKWMISRSRLVLTVDHVWIPLVDVDPADPADVALLGYDRERALTVAYDYANRWRTS